MEQELHGHRDLEASQIAMQFVKGYGRKSTREFRCFIGNSIGSLLEAETQLEIARDLGYLDSKSAVSLFHQSSRLVQLLYGLRSWTERKLDAQVSAVFRITNYELRITT